MKMLYSIYVSNLSTCAIMCNEVWWEFVIVETFPEQGLQKVRLPDLSCIHCMTLLILLSKRNEMKKQTNKALELCQLSFSQCLFCMYHSVFYYKAHEILNSNVWKWYCVSIVGVLLISECTVIISAIQKLVSVAYD